MISLADISGVTDTGAAARMLGERFKGDESRLLSELDAGLNQLLRIDLNAATRFVKRVQHFADLLTNANRPRLIAMQARLHHWKGRNDLAGDLFQRAQREFQRARNYLDAARTGIGLMDVYMYLGDYRQAIQTGRKSLRYFRRKHMDVDAARVMTNIGNVYHRTDNNRAALRYYDQARDVFADRGGIPLAIVEFNRANIFANLNELKQAAKLYQVSASIYRKHGMTIAESQARYSLAYLYFLEDRYADALKLFEEVYSTFTESGDTRSAAVTELDLVEINLELNQYGSAIMLGESVATRFHRLKMRYEEGKALYFVSMARFRLGDNHEALKQLRRSEKLFRREGNDLWLGMIHHARMKVFLSDRLFAKAVSESSQAVRLFTKSGDERRETDVRLTLAEAYVKNGQFAGAGAIMTRLSKKDLLGYQKYYLFELEGAQYYQQEQYARALTAYKKAVNTVEKMLVGLYPDEIRFFFVADKYDSYQRVVDCLLQLNRVEKAFVFNLRAISILNHQTGLDARLISEVPEKMLATRERLRTSLRKLNQAPKTGQRGGVTLAASARIEQRLLDNERRIRAAAHRPGKTYAAERAEHVRLNDLLGPDETVISYTDVGGNIGAFCGNKDRIGYLDLGRKTADLEELIQKTHFVFEGAVFGMQESQQARDAADAYLTELYDALVAPFEGKVGNNRLLVVAEGPIGQVPFGALKTRNGRPLCETRKVRLTVNPQDLIDRGRNKSSFRGNRNAIFAVSSDVLPAVGTEAERIARTFKGAGKYIDRSATREGLISELNAADGFIHIAAHASRSSENPLFSRILMGDGPFFPFDLFETGVRARLVTLSGCQTAAPGLYYGNSFSLAKAFYQAGARHVLASLWPVSDKLSMVFMTGFYRTLFQTDDVVISFDRAVDELRKLTDNPALWGSFVLLGV